MRILVIPTTDWTNHPVPNRLNHICNRLAGMGHSVDVMWFRYDKYSGNIPLENKCAIHYAGSMGVNESLVSYYRKFYSIHRGMIRALCDEKEIDIILSANIIPSYAAISAGKPIVYDYLDVMDEAACAYLTGATKFVAKHTTNFLMKRILHSAKQIITVSPSLVGYIKQKYNIDNNRIPVIPNGVDTTIFTPRDKEVGRKFCEVNNKFPIIGYVGSVERWVDLETPIRALQGDANLVIIGPSLHTDYWVELRKVAEECGCEDRVKFISSVPYNDLPVYISGFDVGLNPLMPSAHNIYSAGGKIFDYMACGVPVVSTECDPGSIVKRQMFFYDDIGERTYLEAVSRAMDATESAREEMKLSMRRYDWDVLAKKYEEVLMSVLQ